MDEDAIILWQDVLDEIAAGRADSLTCPHCKHTPLEVTQDGRTTRISCPNCKQYIEGVFSAG